MISDTPNWSHHHHLHADFRQPKYEDADSDAILERTASDKEKNTSRYSFTACADITTVPTALRQRLVEIAHNSTVLVMTRSSESDEKNGLLRLTT